MAPSSKAPLGTLYFVDDMVYKAEKALVAAKFNGITLEKKPVSLADAAGPEVLAKNPTGKVPFLETDMGCVFTSNSIARCVARCRADTSLYGRCFDDENKIDTWMEFCTQEIEIPLMTWVYPTKGLMQDVPEATKMAQEDMKKALLKLEASLQSSTYLIGDFLSLADVVVVCALREGFERVFEPAFRKPFPKVCAWFEACCSMPQFKAGFAGGAVKLCTQAAKPVAPKQFAPPPRKAEKTDEKKEKPAAPPKQEQKKNAKDAPAKQPVAAAAAPNAAPPGAAAEIEAKIKAVGDEVRALKEKLKAEGCTGKKLNEHADIKELVAKLTELKAQLAAAPAAAPAAPAPAAPAPAAPTAPSAPTSAAPAASASGDVATQITSVGDEIRVLKAKLKGEGLSGKKINEHEEVKSLVAKLQELKAKA